ncbi:MAG: hypothetical protein ACFFCW_10095 [Candidatus Hodarchaeota archaeon]
MDRTWLVSLVPPIWSQIGSFSPHNLPYKVQIFEKGCLVNQIPGIVIERSFVLDNIPELMLKWPQTVSFVAEEVGAQFLNHQFYNGLIKRLN